MKKIIYVCMALIMFVTVAGCNGYLSNEEKDETVVITKVPSDDVANVITVSVYNLDTFNPLATNSPSVKDAMKFIYEPLFTHDENMNIVPVLADSYSVSPDGNSVDIKLREDVLWHDGSQFTAADVNYTIKNLLSGSTTYGEAMGNISGCSVIDNYLIRINMSKATPDVASVLTFPILKNKTSMQPVDSYKPIGTGAFAYSGKISVDRYMLVASDCYYKGKAKLSGVYIDVVPDERRYHTMFDSGNIDVCSSELLKNYEHTAKANINTNEYITNELLYIGINHNSAKLSDRNVRKAISAFVDRKAIEEYTMYSGVKATDTVINPVSEYSYSPKSNLKPDSVKGSEYLKAAGWIPQVMGYSKKVGGAEQKLNMALLVNSDNQADVKIAEKVKEKLMAGGIDIQLQNLNETAYNQRINAGNYDLYIGRKKMPTAMDVSGFLGSQNRFGYANPTIDIIMSEAAKEIDKEKIKELYKQLYDVLSEDMPVVPLAYSKSVTYMSARIENVSPMGMDGFYRDLQNWSIK